MSHEYEIELALEELLSWALDACHQGAGESFMSSPVWHGFLSTWEDAEELLPRVAALLGTKIIQVEYPSSWSKSRGTVTHGTEAELET